MNILKKILICFATLNLILYLSFVFILPKSLDLNKYSKLVEDNFLKQREYNILLNSPKISTSYNLNLIIEVEKAEVFYNKEKISQINGLKMNINFLPLIFRVVKISNINVSKLMIEIPQDIEIFQDFSGIKVRLFEKLPDVDIDYFRVSLKDGKDKYTIKGNNFILRDNILLKKTNISCKGLIRTNDKDNIKYDVSFIFRLSNKTQWDIKKIYDFFRNLKKYSIKSNVTLRVDVSDLSNIRGVVSITDFGFTSENKNFSRSFGNINFNKNKVDVNFEIFTNKENKVKVIGNFDYGSKKNLNLEISSDEVELRDVALISRTFLKSLGLNILDKVNVEGLLKANFKVRSDFKNIVSYGKLFIKNTKVSYGSYLVDRINSEVDFSGNKIKINKAQASFKNYPIYINGFVDTNAFVDIGVKSENLKLKDFVDSKLLKENVVEGFASFKADINGHIKNLESKAVIILTNGSIKNKKTGVSVKNAQTSFTLKGQNTDLVVNNVLISDKEGINSVLIPKIVAKIKNNNLEISKTSLWIDNVRTEVTGKIENIFTNPNINGIKIYIPQQNDLSGPKKSKISIGGDLIISGSIRNPMVKGNITIPKITIPEYLMTLKNISLIADNGIRLSCPYIEIATSIIRLNAYKENLMQREINIVNINADYLDINRIKSIFRGQEYYPDILTGTIKANRLEIENIKAENLVANLSQKDNILYIKDLMLNAYSGKIAGNISYNNKKNVTEMALQVRGVDSYNAIRAISGKEQDIHGRCDIDTKLKFSGDTQKEIQKTMKGDVKFIINNFNSGNIGKLDYLIQAQNILSYRVFQSSLNMVKNALKLKDIGVYKYAQGEMYIDKGFAFIKNIKMAGPSMSLYMRGRYYIPDNTAFILILGRISDDIVSTLGTIGEVSGYKVGSVVSAFMSDLTTVSDIRDVLEVPDLTVKTNFKTQEFKVLINGDIDKETSVKTFKWIRRESQGSKGSNGYVKVPNINDIQRKQKNDPSITVQTVNKQIINKQTKTSLPDFIERLPEFNSKNLE